MLTRLLSLSALLTSSLLAAAPTTAPAPITPGTPWLDDRGQLIQAHGGGILHDSGTYYWFGEDRSPDLPRGHRAVACYSSTDLTHWQFRRRVLDTAAPDNIGPHWVLERPKVFHNPKTGKYVMYMHVDGPSHPGAHDGYALARVGVATSDTPDGTYHLLRTFRPLNQESRDIGQFVDDDGSAYLIFESRPTHGFFIAQLSDDYLTVEKQTAFIKMPLEGGALIHHDGLYYVLGSHLTGWAPNPNVYATAPRLQGPWSTFHDIAPPSTNTYGSQSTFLLKITGTQSTTILFLADLWNPNDLPNSRYLWMPLEITQGHLHLPPPRPWSINTQTGQVTYP